MRREGESRSHYYARMEQFNEEWNSTKEPKKVSGLSNGLPGVRLIRPDDDSWD